MSQQNGSPGNGNPDGAVNPYVAVYAQRLGVQGAEHPGTMSTLLNLLLTRAAGRDADERERPEPSDLPAGTGPDGVRLEGDHVDLLAAVLERALALQESETAALGPDHPRALLATCLLAHALAAADQLDGQLESAQILIDDAHDGLVELAAGPPGTVDPDAVRIAEALHDWIHRRVEESGDDPGE